MPPLTQSNSRPLDAYPFVRTRNADELRSSIAQLFVDPKFSIQGDNRTLHGWINYRPLRQTGLMYGSYGAAIEANFGVMNFFVQGIPIRGAGEQQTNGAEVSVDRSKAGILLPGQVHRLKFEAGFEHLALKIDRAALVSKLSAIIGAPVKGDLAFDLPTDFLQPAAIRLRNLVEFLVKELEDPVASMPPAALAEAEQALMVWFLCANRNNYSPLLEGQARAPAPWQVRRAEEYIEAHWDQPISVEALAETTGVSVRSLFHQFKQSRGYSPMALLKQLRLQRAKQMLTHPSTQTSVTDVAFACGFGNLGHFARDFRNKFGELPSAVLSRSKGGPYDNR